MKPVLILILLSVSFVPLSGRSAIQDTTTVSKEDILRANIQNLTRELELTTEQQSKLFFVLSKSEFMETTNFVYPKEFFEILTFSQRSSFLKLREMEKKYLEVELGTSNKLKSLGGGNSIILNDADHIRDVCLGLNNHPDGSHSANTNYSTYKRICLHAWTYSGSPMYRRSIMKFILNEIPVGSRIISATLYLYSDPEITSPSSAEGNSQLSGSNAFYIERITEPWEDLTVTWNNQPSSTTEGRILFPASTSVTENIQVDLTDMVQTWINTPDLNYGIKMFLQTEVRYRARNYASMEHENTSIRPRLIINYDTPESTIEYTYDDAGNRIARHVVVIENNSLKSATDDEAKSESPMEAVSSEWSDVLVNVFPNPTLGDVSISFMEL